MRTAKRVFTTIAVAIMMIANMSLIESVDVQAKASPYGHTKKVTMQPLNTENHYLTNKGYMDETESASDINKVYKQLDAIIKECGINTNTTEYDAVDRLDTWITKNIKYGDNGFNTDTVEAVLKTKKAICLGYCKLFDALCDRIGIKSIGVHSTDHAWNIVQINGVWYHIDTCWNACLQSKEYFLLSESEIQKETEHHKITYIDEKSILQTYTIKYNLKGGKNKKANITKYTTATSVYTAKEILYTPKNFKFKNPTRKGYTFKGWYSNGKKITNLKQVVGTNPTLTAKWEKVNKPALKNVKLKVDKKSFLYMNKITLTWKKSANTKYEIKYVTKEGSKKLDWGTYKTSKNKLSFTIIKNSTYNTKITVRAYRQDSAGKKTYSKAKTFTVK